MRNWRDLNGWNGDSVGALDTKDNVFVDTDERVIYLSDDVDNACIGLICSNIILANAADDSLEKTRVNFTREPIRIYINSFGGSVYDMWALIDTIQESKTPIHTYCQGYAMSAAFQIFLAGHKRFCSRHSTFMYHQMHCYRSGKYQDMVEDREQMDYMNKQMEEFVKERTKLTQKDLDSIREKKKDNFFTAKQAKELGIVDEILGGAKVKDASCQKTDSKRKEKVA